MPSSLTELRPDPAAPVRAVRLGPREAIFDHRADGTIYIRSPHKLAPHPAKLTERLEHWANVAPDRTFMAQRDALGGWRRISYAQTLEQVRRIATALLRRELSPERPIVILSGNDIEHALLGLAAMYIGIPYAPISPPYSLISTDFGKLKHILDLLTPGLVFAADGEVFSRAIEAAVSPALEVVVTRNPSAHRPMTLFAELAGTRADPAADAAHARGRARHHREDPVHVGLDRHAEGRDQHPAHVVLEPGDAAHLARLLPGRAAGDRRLGAVASHRRRQPRRRPRARRTAARCISTRASRCPARSNETVRNLREIAPTWYFTVPKGYEALLPFLRADDELRRELLQPAQGAVVRGRRRSHSRCSTR